jgi:MFS family permease
MLKVICEDNHIKSLLIDYPRAPHSEQVAPCKSPMNNTIQAQSREENANFHHLVMDIAWFGIALTASSRFLPVYAIRLNATPLELGLVSALPSLILLFSTLAAGWWRRKYGSGAAAFFWPNLGFRLSYLLCALTPFFPPAWQAAWLILAVSLPAIPQGIFSVNFVILICESIDKKHITALTSRRSLAMNITIAAGALAFGFWLEKVFFPVNYSVMFLVAFVCTLFSLRSTMKLKVIYPQPIDSPDERKPAPWHVENFMPAPLLGAAMHIAIFIIAPIIPMRLVDELGFGEGFMAVFGMLELSGAAVMALRTNWLVERIGHTTMIGLTMIAAAVATALLAFATNTYLILAASALIGATWGAAQVGLFGFFSNNAPSHDMTRYTTFYHCIIFLAMFVGPMLGSAFAQAGVNLVFILLVGAVLRALVGFAALHMGWPTATRLWKTAHH